MLEALVPWNFGPEQLARCLRSFSRFPFGLCLTLAGVKESLLAKLPIKQTLNTLIDSSDDPNALICQLILLAAWARAGVDVDGVEDEILDLLECILGKGDTVPEFNTINSLVNLDVLEPAHVRLLSRKENSSLRIKHSARNAVQSFAYSGDEFVQKMTTLILMLTD